MISLPSTPYVSFDIFDTLVTRISGRPSSIFDCAANRALANGIAGAEAFPALRTEAEARAIARVGADQMTLADIYESLVSELGRDDLAPLKELEIATEQDLCVPIPAMVKFLTRCIEAGKTVVLISDMYLPHDVVSGILKACGVKGYKKLFVSCEYGKTKRTGELFKCVLSDLGIVPGDLTHYGDDSKADYVAPRKLGCSACLIKWGQATTSVNALTDRVKRRLAPNRYKADFLSQSAKLYSASELDRVGYSVLGPILVEFCSWISEVKAERDYESLVFVARDGYLMKRAYDILYPDCATSYLLASRRSVTVPMLWRHEGIAAFRETVGLGYEMSVEEILMRLGMNRETATSYAESAGLTLQDRLLCDCLEDDERFVALYEKARHWIAKNSKEEYAAMSAYYSDVFGIAGRIALVDLGWRGSIQHSLTEAAELLGFNCDIEGLYFGVTYKSRWFDVQPMFGFLFSKGRDEEMAHEEEWFNALVEAFFVAPHGSAGRYYIDQTGAPQVELGPVDDENSPLYLLQESALRYVSDFKNRNWSTYGFMSRTSAVSALYELGLTPTVNEAVALGDCIYAFQEISPLAKPHHGFIYYVGHPKALYHEMSVCYWKPAYLRRLLRLPLPYWRLLKAIKQVVRG